MPGHASPLYGNVHEYRIDIRPGEARHVWADTKSAFNGKRLTTMASVLINMPDTFTVSIRGIDVAIDYTTAIDPTEMAQRLFDYGHRKFNDSAPKGEKAPPKDASDEDKAAFAAKCAANAKAMIADWLDGNFETDRESAPRDPIAAEVNRLAGNMTNAKLGKLTKDTSPADKKAWYARKAEYAAMDAVKALAAKNVKEAADLAALIDGV